MVPGAAGLSASGGRGGHGGLGELADDTDDGDDNDYDNDQVSVVQHMDTMAAQTSTTFTSPHSSNIWDKGQLWNMLDLKNFKTLEPWKCLIKSTNL